VTRLALGLALMLHLTGCTMATVYGIAAAAGIASIAHDVIASKAILDPPPGTPGATRCVP
jgi:hypothetical protein